MINESEDSFNDYFKLNQLIPVNSLNIASIFSIIRIEKYRINKNLIFILITNSKHNRESLSSVTALFINNMFHNNL